jgi:hypothetical protein
MKRQIRIASKAFVAPAIGVAIFARDERTREGRRPTFPEFRGFENWPVIGISQNHSTAAGSAALGLSSWASAGIWR